MSVIIPAGGTLVLYDDEGQVVQYSLEAVELTVEEAPYCRPRIEISALMGGENFVDLSNRRDEELTLLLELWSEQRRLGASAEALADTRARIERRAKEEA